MMIVMPVRPPSTAGPRLHTATVAVGLLFALEACSADALSASRDRQPDASFDASHGPLKDAEIEPPSDASEPPGPELPRDAGNNLCVPRCEGTCGGAPDGCGGECQQPCEAGSLCANQRCAECSEDSDCSGAERCDPITSRCEACDGDSCWRSALYPADWTPGSTDAEGRFLHDFSYAGYAGGLREIFEPSTAHFDITAYGSGPDWTSAIQLAIDAAISAGGGVVDLPAGEYRVDGRLEVNGSNVLLKGAGQDVTRVYFSSAAGMSDHAHLEFGRMPIFGAPIALSADGLSREFSVDIEDAGDLSEGDEVAVGFVISAAFRAEHGMESYWGFAAEEWRPIFWRTVMSIHPLGAGGYRVTFDVPLRYPVRVRDSASLRRIEGTVREVGVEALTLSNAVELSQAQSENRVSLISFRGVKDGWVRRLRTYSSPLSSPPTEAQHLQSHGISVVGSRQITVEDIALGPAQNRGSGGNGYLVEISRSNEVLVQRATLRGGRHNFSFNWDFGNSGIVIRDSSSEGSRCDGAWVACRSEFHHSLAMAVLIENSELSDGWVGGNRRAESSGAGHTVTESVYWRLYGSGDLYSWQYGHGYLIGNDLEVQFVELADTSDALWELEWYPFWALNSNGHTSLHTEPEDFLEGSARRSALVPASLYADQLLRRQTPR